jgi:hypothetical protein
MHKECGSCLGKEVCSRARSGQHPRNVASHYLGGLASCKGGKAAGSSLGPPWLCLTPDNMNRKTGFAL